MTLSMVFKLSGQFRRDEQANVYVGFCKELGIYSQATTLPESKVALKDAITLFLGSCLKFGIWEETLKEKIIRVCRLCDLEQKKKTAI